LQPLPDSMVVSSGGVEALGSVKLPGLPASPAWNSVNSRQIPSAQGSMGILPGSMPQGSWQMPQGSMQMPQGSMPQGSMPQGSMQMPQGSIPQGSWQMPQGSMEIPVQGSMQMPGSWQMPTSMAAGSMQMPGSAPAGSYQMTSMPGQSMPGQPMPGQPWGPQGGPFGGQLPMPQPDSAIDSMGTASMFGSLGSVPSVGCQPARTSNVMF